MFGSSAMNGIEDPTGTMTDRLLFDTDVLIDYLRGTPEAVDFMSSREEDFLVSTITVAELYAGVRSDEEAERMDTFLRGFEAIPVSRSVAREGGRLREKYASSHGLELADAVIAVTARMEEARLVTRNEKHYPMMEDLLVPYTLE